MPKEKFPVDFFFIDIRFNRYLPPRKSQGVKIDFSHSFKKKFVKCLKVQFYFGHIYFLLSRIMSKISV